MQSNQSIFYHTPNRLKSLWTLGQPTILETNEEFSPTPDLGILQIKDTNGQLLERMNYKFQNEFLCSQSKYIQLTNLRMKTIRNKQMQGILIANNKECIQLYASKNKLFDQIYEYVKKYTIQQDFLFNYDIIKIRGKGTFAKVYKVMNVNSKLKYAVKAFKKKQQKLDADLSNEIQKEIEILRDLNHQYIIKLHEVYEDDNYVYLVMDYLQGSDLQTAMENEKNSKYDEQSVQNIIWKLLTAASYIHKRNIMHRDFKLENIILKYKNDIDDIVVVDFGLSDFYTPKANYIHNRCGTLGYVAPEILKDQPYDCKVDIFSLGVIMFTLLAQQFPFNYQDTDQILIANENCQIDFTLLEQKQISPNGINLIDKMLKQDPKQRITADEALQHDWFKQEAELGSSILIKLSNMTSNNLLTKQLNFKQNSPLWKLQSLESIKDSEGSPCIKKETKFFDQFIQDDEFQIEDDVIEHEGSPTIRVQKYKLLARQKSL